MFNRYRIYAAYLFAIPLALILGILASSPDELTFMLVGMLLCFLALPLFIKWHHAMLIVFWNSAFSAFFLPGQPTFWLLFALLSFGLSVLSHVMGRRQFLRVPEMTRPLLFMAAVVVCTAWYRGGIGIRILGGAANGGKNYIYLLGAIMGYFALTAGPIPVLKSRMMAGLFFASGTTSVLSNIAYALGPGFYIVYYLVPAGLAMDQAASDYTGSIDRIQGLSSASIAGLCFLLAHYGIRGLFNVARTWRLVFLCLTVGAGFFAGYRTTLALLFLIFAFQFDFEGLARTRFFPVVVGLAIAGFVSLLVFVNRMPLAVQRAASFLPVNVESDIRDQAMGSANWRFQMWALVWKDVPRYLVIGKGYSIDPAEIESTAEGIRRGILNNYEEPMLVGDYHNGPLSVIIPFGMVGSVAFVWVLIAGFRVLYSNYRHGDARLRQINSVLLAYYLAYCVSFFLIFGALNTQLFNFLGAVGFGVSLNGGVVRKPRLLPERGRDSLPEAYATEVK